MKLLPEELNQILIITVVFSMALTPALAALGVKLGDIVDAMEAADSSIDEDRAPKRLEVSDMVGPVIRQGWGWSASLTATGRDSSRQHCMC